MHVCLYRSGVNLGAMLQVLSAVFLETESLSFVLIKQARPAGVPESCLSLPPAQGLQEHATACEFGGLKRGLHPCLTSILLSYLFLGPSF